MIKKGATLHAQRIPIECLQVKIHGQRYSERLGVPYIEEAETVKVRANHD